MNNLCVLPHINAKKRVTCPEDNGNLISGILPEFVLHIFSFGYFQLYHFLIINVTVNIMGSVNFVSISSELL